jgi:serine/threonine protein kinase
VSTPPARSAPVESRRARRITLSLSAGEHLGRYEIVSLVGRGAMGEVYRAFDASLRREVAVKIAAETPDAASDGARRFAQEAQLVAGLSHPNVVAVHDFGSDRGRLFIVSELLDGRTLREQIDGGPLDWRTALDVAVQAGRALAAAHEKGVVHRDLKPDNVVVLRNGTVKVLDFGLAKALDRDALASISQVSTAEVTSPGLVAGTLGYMSPEQLRGGPIDARADVFALGVLLYEMVTGRRPFAGPSAVDAMAAALTAEPAPLDVADAVPLEPVIRRCLEKDPTRRYGTAGEVVCALEALRLAVPARRRLVVQRGMLAAAAALAAVAAILAAAAAGALSSPRT